MIRIINKIKVMMLGYNREMETLDNEMRANLGVNVKSINLSKTEKYIKNCNNAMNTNSIFY